MTTFQYIIDAILSALTHIIPISEAIPHDLFQTVLKWPAISPELQFQVCMIGTLSFLVFFRYDWLGLISALIKSIIQPTSLRSDRRTLDQQTVLFLAIICIPSLIIRHFLRAPLFEVEASVHPFVMAAIFFIIAGLLQFACGWNKRLKGLNHVRLVDAVFISALCILSLHPAFSIVALLWIGFALTNYHYEAIFKYSMLVLGIYLVSTFLSLLREVSIQSAFEGVGALNSIAVIVITFTTFWMTLENLQRNMSESTLRGFKWFSVLCGLFYLVIYFIRG